MTAPTLLAVSDSQEDIHAFEHTLAEHLPGCEIMTARSADEAVDLARTIAIDVAIVEAQMAGSDSVELCGRLRDVANKAHPTILLVVEAHATEAAARGLDAGVTDFLVRPIDGIELTARVKTMLRLKRAEDDLRNCQRQGAEPAPTAAGHDWAQQYLDVAEVMLLALDSQGQITLINQKGCAILGYGEADLLGKNWFDTCMPPSIRAGARDVFRQLVSGETEPVEYHENPVLTRFGQQRLIAWHNAILTDEAGAVAGTLSSGEDITARRRAEDGLRKFKSVADQSNNGTAITDLDGKLTYANQTFAKMHGYSRDDLLGKHLSVLHNAAQIPRVEALLDQLLEDGEFADEEVWHVRKDGTPFPTTMSAMVVRDDHGTPTYLAVTAIEVTAQQAAQRALTESEERYRTLVEASPNSILAIQGGHHVFANPAAAHMLGFGEPAQVVGRPALHAIAPDSRDLVIERMKRLGAGKSNPPVEVELLRPDGSTLTIESTSVPITMGGEEAILVIGQDITERKKAQDQLRQREEEERRFAAQLTALHKVTNELSRTQSVHELCRRAVELARELLGFDRLGIWFVGSERNVVEGSFGVDEHGNVRDERDRAVHVAPSSAMGQILTQAVPWQLWHDTELFRDSGRVVGHGDKAIASIWDGEQISGFIAADNLLNGEPIDERQCELLDLFASTVGHLRKQKLAEAGMTVFSGLGHRLSAARTVERASRIIVETADQLFGWDACFVRLCAIDTDEYRPVVYIDVVDGERVDVTPPAGLTTPTPFLRRVLSEGAQLILREDPLEQPENWNRFGNVDRLSASLMFVPIRYRDGAIGVLSIQSYRPQAYSDDDLHALQGLADLCGGALERIRSEEALREGEARLSSIFRAAPVGIGVVCDRALLQVNDRVCQMTGRTSEELVGQNARVLYPTDEDYEYVGAEKYRQIQEQGAGTVETHWQHKDGTVIDVLLSSTPLDPDDLSAGVTFTALDITARKRAEAERLRLATAVEQAAESILVADSDGAIQYVNPAFERVTGFARDEAIGQTCRLVKSGQHDGPFYRDLWETISRGDVWRGRFTNKRKDGTLYEEEATISPIRDASGQIAHFVDVRRDVTHEAELEEQLRQAQKMQAIGTLAGGIAHDFNNILSPIVGYTEMALEEAHEESRFVNDLQQVLAAAHRAADLVRQILTVSRQQEHERSHVRVGPIVKEAMKLLRASLPSTIDVQTSIRTQSDVVLADATQIHQVLMNLCTNAGHAMRREGGVLTVVLDSGDVSCCPGACCPDNAPCLSLTVIDTGHGMEPEIADRAFEPYYTTKERGEGTGLGLAVVHGIVEGHDGRITVESEPGVGTTFQVCLPLAEAAEASPAEDQAPLPRGDERILLVDDEPALVRITQRMLEALGYRVTSFTRSAEALDAFAADPESFDLVVTDMTMPGMTGVELAKKLMSERPRAPIILCTGFSELITPEKAKRMGISEFLMKPIRPRVLARAVRDSLNRVLQ